MKKTLIVDPINLFVRVVEAPDDVVDGLQKAAVPVKAHMAGGHMVAQHMRQVEEGEHQQA